MLVMSASYLRHLVQLVAMPIVVELGAVAALGVAQFPPEVQVEVQLAVDAADLECR